MDGRRKELTIMRLATFLLFQVLVLLHQVRASVSATWPGSVTGAEYCSRRDPSMNPVYEKRFGQDVVWQIPPNPKAVLFIGHGKDKEPLSFFDSGPNCKQCYGLPEDREAVLEALHRSYAVIMVKSVMDYYRPWNVESWPPEMSQDRVNVVSVINDWTRENSLEHLPLAAFGYSTGGNFSTLLTLDLEIKSLVLMCTPGEFLVLERADKSQFPPVLFLPMPADNGPIGFYQLSLAAIEILKAEQILVAEIDLWPKPISPSYFAERILCMETSVSENIYAALKAEGWLNEFDYLVLNPRLDDWESVLRKWNVLPFCKVTNGLCYADHVQQELSVAYAEHSFSSAENEAIFNWFDFTLFGPSTGVTGRASS